MAVTPSSYFTTPSLTISEKITSLLKGWSLSPTMCLVGLIHTGLQFIEDTSVSCCIHRRAAVLDGRLLKQVRLVLRKCWPNRVICEFLRSQDRANRWYEPSLDRPDQQVPRLGSKHSSYQNKLVIFTWAEFKSTDLNFLIIAVS